MKRKVVDVDFNLLKECCSEQGMELIPATSAKYIELTDEHGNKYKVMPSDNIFDWMPLPRTPKEREVSEK